MIVLLVVAATILVMFLVIQVVGLILIGTGFLFERIGRLYNKLMGRT